MKFRLSLFVIGLAVIISSCEDHETSETITFSENFENESQWEIKLQKPSNDTISRVEFGNKNLTLFAGNGDGFSPAVIQVQKTISEIDLNNYGSITEIGVKIKCSNFPIAYYWTSRVRTIEIKIGPYILRQYDQQSFSSSPGPAIVEFNFVIVVPKSTFAIGQATLNATHENETQSKKKLEGDYFEILENQFYANPVVQFSCSTYTGEYRQIYPQTFQISSVDIELKYQP